MDENKVWELAQSVERTAVNQKHILKLLDRLQTRVETIEKHDGLQEERMAQMQETIATLVESVQRVDDASHRLQHIALGFVVLPCTRARAGRTCKRCRTYRARTGRPPAFFT